MWHYSQGPDCGAGNSWIWGSIAEQCRPRLDRRCGPQQVGGPQDRNGAFKLREIQLSQEAWRDGHTDAA